LICRCGYNFSKERLAIQSAEEQRNPAFAVINDEDYHTYLESEVKVLTANSKKNRVKAIGESAQFVGTMCTCPECARLVLNLPNGEKTEFYVRED
jgi:hypothetical protein